MRLLVKLGWGILVPWLLVTCGYVHVIIRGLVLSVLGTVLGETPLVWVTTAVISSHEFSLVNLPFSSPPPSFAASSLPPVCRSTYGV